MSLVRFDPFREMMELQERINNLFSERLTRTGGREEAMTQAMWTPAVDIFESADELVIKAELPEVKKDDVQINVENNILTLKGERRLENEERRDNYHRIERLYGTFTRSFTLPSNVDQNKITAEFKDGVLRIVLPKREEAKPRQIAVKVN